jgi:MORN repeat
MEVSKPPAEEKVDAQATDDHPINPERKSEDARKSRTRAQLTESRPLVINESLEDGFHRLEFENGTYIGYIKDNKRSGHGKYVWNDGNEYEGDWLDDMKEGDGVFRWQCGDTYQGQYSGDKRAGQGTKTYANGDTYTV